MPCSGLNSAARRQTPELKSRSIVLEPSAARPVWFVMSPTLLPASGENFCMRKTSIPLRTFGGTSAAKDVTNAATPRKSARTVIRETSQGYLKFLMLVPFALRCKKGDEGIEEI